MSLSQHLSEYIAACFTGIWIQSHEHDDALAELAQLCQRESWRLATWDLAQGLRLPGQQESLLGETSGGDPLSAIHALRALAQPDTSALLVLVNFHRCCRPNSLPRVGSFSLNTRDGGQDTVRKKEGPAVNRSLRGG